MVTLGELEKRAYVKTNVSNSKWPSRGKHYQNYTIKFLVISIEVLYTIQINQILRRHCYGVMYLNNIIF